MSKKQQEKLVYKVIKENKKVPYESEIEVSGIVNTFTPRQLLSDIFYNEKTLREIEDNIKIRTASMQNVANTNPIVTRMGEKDLVAAYIYYEALAFNKEASKRKNELIEALDAIKERIKIIESQTGIKIEKPVTLKEVIKENKE